ncbi:lytic murein transglycosylase [Nonomuraea sp. NBC_01738]|uniref:lytic transglycosylase domain-containing protein n=1 Tax=Nonomuraea sp. NBC_01738 TaxID=2976003 RepID=UPI002E0D325E|nr:lytic murein transglycosylase [Nonomuraea sp. NBC_01738]
MRLIAAPLAVLLTGLTGCAATSATSAAPGTRASTQAGAQANSVPSVRASGGAGQAAKPESGGTADAPAAEAKLPSGATAVAAAIRKNTAALYEAVDAGSADVPLYALYQQRVYRMLARNRALSAQVTAKLAKPLAAEAADNITAVSKLLSMARPITAAQRAKIRLARPEPAKRLRAHMVAAEKRFGVEWEVLAAIMLVETRFGRVRSSSSTGAQGPMQFMPGTWKQYGLGGDVHDARDAVLAAANYLKASGAPRDYRKAVFAYNHDTRYVDAVLAHARQMKRDPRSFHAYYNWQVFVLSAKGDVRLTGPR